MGNLRSTGMLARDRYGHNTRTFTDSSRHGISSRLYAGKQQVSQIHLLCSAPALRCSKTELIAQNLAAQSAWVRVDQLERCVEQDKLVSCRSTSIKVEQSEIATSVGPRIRVSPAPLGSLRWLQLKGIAPPSLCRCKA